MPHLPCQLLDDYLAHDLTDDALKGFEAHLPTCEECQDVVQENQHLAALLSQAVRRERVSAQLPKRIERRLRVNRLRRVAIAASALAAAVALVCWLARPTPTPAPVESPAPPPIVQIQIQPEPEVPPTALQVRVSFPENNVIAVQEPTDSPNVTFIRVYTGLRRPLRASTEQTPEISEGRDQ